MGRLIDLMHLGRDRVIGAYEVGGVVVDPGPASTVEALLDGLGGEAPRALLLTHIHLDHAGAAGVLARRFPELRVYVHERGAPHLVDPSRLLVSAGRLYGERMDDLWGETVPVPPERVATLADGQELAVVGRMLRVIFTPGHASHHVAFWDVASGSAFTGDVGGVRMAGTGYACPPAPPPDLDPEAWAQSVERLRGLGPRRLCLTHGGPFADVGPHLDQLMPNLEALRALALAALREGADDSTVTALIHDHVAARLGNAAPDVLENLEWAAPSYLAAAGLRRLLVKRGEVATE